MNFRVSSLEMLSGLSVASGVAPKRSPKLVLLSLLLRVSGGILSIYATDDELSYVCRLGVDELSSGDAVVDARDLHRIVKSFPSDALIEFCLEDGMLVLSSGKIEFRLDVMSSDEYPEYSRVLPSEMHSYPGSAWLSLLDRTLFAVGTDDVRSHLCGVYVERLEGEGLRAVGTDGHRLALMEGFVPEGMLCLSGCILPRNFVLKLRKMLLGVGDRDVSFGFDGSRVVFDCGDETLVGMLLGGKFPNYRGVLPSSSKLECVLSRQSMIDALKRVSLLSPEKTGGVRFVVSGDELTISSVSAGRGRGREVLKLGADVGGMVFESGYNALYFLDALSSIVSDDVLLKFGDSVSPCLVEPVLEGAVSTQVNVVMPMRL